MAMIYSAWRSAGLKLPLEVSPEECAGKTYIVTGSNIGIGLEVVRNLVAQKPARVIMAVRSLDRGEAARRDVEASTGVVGVAEVWHLDLSSYKSIRDFAGNVHQLDRVDVVIQNAVSAQVDWEVAEGWEQGITVNVLGTMLLAMLLMPYLRNYSKRFGTTPTISFVGSGMAFIVEGELRRLDRERIFEDWNDQAKFPANIGRYVASFAQTHDPLLTVCPTNRYSMSKLLLLFAVHRLAELAPPEKTGVVLNVCDPGPCRNTGLVRYADLLSKLQIKVLYTFISRSAEMGSRAVIYAAVKGKETHGKFAENCVSDEWVSFSL
jgi:NAD(P)-dependent dehydrogenase (short-subunit alcohol dehydrogenase family)